MRRVRAKLERDDGPGRRAVLPEPPPVSLRPKGGRDGKKVGKLPRRGRLWGKSARSRRARRHRSKRTFAGAGPPEIAWGPGRANTLTFPSANRPAIRHERREVLRVPGGTVAVFATCTRDRKGAQRESAQQTEARAKHWIAGHLDGGVAESSVCKRVRGSPALAPHPGQLRECGNIRNDRMAGLEVLRSD